MNLSFESFNRSCNPQPVARSASFRLNFVRCNTIHLEVDIALIVSSITIEILVILRSLPIYSRLTRDLFPSQVPHPAVYVNGHREQRKHNCEHTNRYLGGNWQGLAFHQLLTSNPDC